MDNGLRGCRWRGRDKWPISKGEKSAGREEEKDVRVRSCGGRLVSSLSLPQAGGLPRSGACEMHSSDEWRGKLHWVSWRKSPDGDARWMVTEEEVGTYVDDTAGCQVNI